MICIKVNGVIKWSWHIWVTRPVDEYFDSGSGFTWMDRNLGAAGANSVPDKNGIFYQWGRKDPYRHTGSATAGISSMADLVKNPTSFSTHSGYAGAAGADSWGGETGYKTIHDPCPHGWKVPPITFTGEDGTTYNVWGNADNWDSYWIRLEGGGYAFTGWYGGTPVYYNPTGFLDQSRILTNGADTGYHWSSMRVYGGTNAYFMKFDNTRVTPLSYNNPRFGFVVRCVKE
jgi:hypothetical protein